MFERKGDVERRNHPGDRFNERAFAIIAARRRRDHSLRPSSQRQRFGQDPNSPLPEISRASRDLAYAPESDRHAAVVFSESQEDGHWPRRQYFLARQSRYDESARRSYRRSRLCRVPRGHFFAHDMSRLIHTDTSIGRNCFIRAHAIILPGVRVGAECIVGSGSVVTTYAPSGSIVVGNPARVIRSRICMRTWGILVDACEAVVATEKAERGAVVPSLE